MFKGLFDVIKDENLKIIYQMDGLNIVNYKDIIDFDSNNIIVNCGTKTISIYGNDLIITKLLDSELLIKGDISRIDFR